MAEARQIALRQNAGVMASFLNPIQNEREALKRQGKSPKDHHKDNIRTLREIQNQNRENLERQQSAENNQLFKMPRFLNVESKVKEQMTPPRPEDQRPSTAPSRLFLRAHCKTQMPPPPPKGEIRPRSAHRERRKPPVPTVRENVNSYRPSSPMTARRDFIRANALSVITAKAHHDEQQQSENWCKNENPEFGRVPEYLIARREQLRRQREEEIIEAEQAEIPAGMRIMPESERLETLSVLERARKDRISEILSQRLVLHTPSQRLVAAELENKLTDIDAAIKVFSRKAIIVKDDSAPRPMSAPTPSRWR